MKQTMTIMEVYKDVLERADDLQRRSTIKGSTEADRYADKCSANELMYVARLLEMTNEINPPNIYEHKTI